MNAFGEQIRSGRLAKGMQQRELAAAVGLEVTYLSKIETGRVPPPSESTIKEIAKILDADAQHLLLTASKVPSDVKEMLLQSPRAPEFLRTAQRLRDDDWDQLIAMAERLARVQRQ